MVCHNQSDYKIGVIYFFRGTYQACLRPRDRFWDIPVPKIDSAFDNLFVPQPSWSPSTTQQLRKLVAAPYLPPNDWTPRLDAYFASPLALCARRVSSAASRLLGATSLRFALHGWQRGKCARNSRAPDSATPWYRMPGSNGFPRGEAACKNASGCSKPCGVPARSAPRIICCRYNRHWTHRSPASNCTATSGTPGWHG
ncbi:hypothetical protein [Thiolapillus sp.]|uniref:hypothetical protein n=1 Tax=Thiolapillus sp. TaxID=2017437 RepID=UPI003AF88B25